MKVPHLLAKQRFGLGAALAALALAQAGLAALFAEAMTSIINNGPNAGQMAAAMAIGLAVAIGFFVCAERWIAEKFAQSFVRDCRVAIFETVIRNRGDGNEARWLNSLIGDLSALRNYAVRGSVRLWTSLLAGLVACIWFVYASPKQSMALLPLVAALILVFPAVRLLDKAIARQRQARGKLNRFVIRRVKVETRGLPCPRGHGRNRLQELSDSPKIEAERRAQLFGVIEGLAVIGGSGAALVLVLGSDRAVGVGQLVGQLSIIGFAATRLLEFARALNARSGGKIALARLANLLSRVPHSDGKTAAAKVDFGE